MALVGGVTSIDFTGHDVFAADVIAQRTMSSASVEADNWTTTNAQFFTATTAQTMRQR